MFAASVAGPVAGDHARRRAAHGPMPLQRGAAAAPSSLRQGGRARAALPGGVLPMGEDSLSCQYKRIVSHNRAPHQGTSPHMSTPPAEGTAPVAQFKLSILARHVLPDQTPGCGAKNVEPAIIERLKVRFNETGLQSRRVEIGQDEDEQEAMFGRGWSDGLPLVPPTEERVLRMLDGTARDPQEVLGIVPPALAAATVEKIAINAVMAGCKPEYLPVVLAAVEAVLDESFAMHGVLATTMFVGPVVIVNGAIRRRIGMNAKGNALGQGNRANSSIGRALQLVIRNIGEGRPQEVDRATLGNPGKLGYCFAEDEENSCWEPLSVERGLKPGVSAGTVFSGFGLQGVVDQKSREPESLARSMAGSLKAIHNVKMAPGCDALLVVCPEHERTFRNAGWSKARLYEELYKLFEIPGEDVMSGAKGIVKAGPASLAGKTVNKFRPGGLLIVRAGGGAGMFSGIIGGWSSGARGSVPVTKEVKP